ncbi:MAG TPA: hypothetical protein VF618_05585 [Thermoanaerobaculia bacterium]
MCILRSIIVVAVAALFTASVWGACPAVCPSLNTCMVPVLGGDHAQQINDRIQCGCHANLCPNTTWTLTKTVAFDPYKADVFIYTQGFPRDNTRALIKPKNANLPNGDPFVTLIHGGVWDYNATLGRYHGSDNSQLRNIRVDGGRQQFGHVASGAATVAMGAVTTGQIVDSVTISYPRGGACLAFERGPNSTGTYVCRNAQITNNWFGPAGEHFAIPGDTGKWSDGLQLQCQNSLVMNNEITDATDAGIAVFQSAGSDIHHNIITAYSRDMIYGISMADYHPLNGDFRNVKVHDNIINGEGGMIQIGIGIGPHVRGDCGELNLTSDYQGGYVSTNSLRGWMGYGIAIDGVKNLTVSGNTFSGFYDGTPGTGCDLQMAEANRCLYKANHTATSSLQSPCMNVGFQYSLHGATTISR